jgi:hypothetical protein
MKNTSFKTTEKCSVQSKGFTVSVDAKCEDNHQEVLNHDFRSTNFLDGLS